MIRLRKKYLFAVLLIAVVLGIVVMFILWSRSSSEGRILTPQTIKGPTTYYDKTLDGKYFSFQYSGKYLAHDDGPRDNDIERYTLSADTHYDKRIAASVANLPDGRLESDGSYIFRQKSSNLYNGRKVVVGDKEVTVWVKKDGTEQTAMLPHGNVVAVISLVTAGSGDDLSTEMNALLKTFSWKK